jgi:hypothetical protein
LTEDLWTTNSLISDDNHARLLNERTTEGLTGEQLDLWVMAHVLSSLTLKDLDDLFSKKCEGAVDGRAGRRDCGRGGGKRRRHL